MFNRRVFMTACTSLFGLVTSVFGKVRREPLPKKDDFTALPAVTFVPNDYPLIYHLAKATLRAMVNEQPVILAQDVSIEAPRNIVSAGNDDPTTSNIYPVTVRIGRLIAPQVVIDAFYRRYGDVGKMVENILIIEDADAPARMAFSTVLTRVITTSISSTIQSNDMAICEDTTLRALFSPVNRIYRIADTECLTVLDGDVVRSFVSRVGGEFDVMVVSRPASDPIPLGYGRATVAISKGGKIFPDS